MYVIRFFVLYRSFVGALVFATLCRGAVAGDVGGRVLYSYSGMPVAGAYVFARYSHNVGTLFGHSSSKCTATRGMLTSSDGSFSFPVVKGRRIDIEAIKPGYRDDYRRRVNYKRKWYGTTHELSPNLFLTPSTGGDGSVNFAFVCDSPALAADLRANLEYLKLILAEAKKFGSPVLQANVQKKINNMESDLR